MSIIISDLSYHYPNQKNIFEHLSLSINNNSKCGLVGNNGRGKSTLLKLIAGYLKPVSGDIYLGSKPVYIPQLIESNFSNVANMLGVDKKIVALNAIANGSISQTDFDILEDDWDIETKCEIALSYWGLSYLNLNTEISQLSGGERIKVYLSKLNIFNPKIILFDEPTNHLDLSSRELLYNYIEQTKATMLVVSHDITLLNQLEAMYEISHNGINLYGGNYSFYENQKEIEDNAIINEINYEKKKVNEAQKKAREIIQRQAKRQSQGSKKNVEVRILKKTTVNRGENTQAKLKEKHDKIISDNIDKLKQVQEQRELLNKLKFEFEYSKLHKGKLLISAKGINKSFEDNKFLWSSLIDFELYSGERIHIIGNNASGKTTLIKLITKQILPSCGKIENAEFNYWYLDQNYSILNNEYSILEIAQKHNQNNLKDFEVKHQLTRALFTSNQWDKKCKELSGGEKMRLCMCCMIISNKFTDLIILDEPTNNLDISSLKILLESIKNYKGSLIIISHDKYFTKEIGITKEYFMPITYTQK